MKKAEVKITVEDGEVTISINSNGVNNYELAGLLSYAQHSINQIHFEINREKNKDNG